MMDVDLDGTIVLLARVAEPASLHRVNGTRHAGDNCTSGSERTRFTGTLGGTLGRPCPLAGPPGIVAAIQCCSSGQTSAKMHSG